MQNFRALGAPPPDPLLSGGWELCPQTPSFRQLGALTPYPHWPPADPQSSPLIVNFWLRAWLKYTIYSTPERQVGLFQLQFSLGEKKLAFVA